MKPDRAKQSPTSSFSQHQNLLSIVVEITASQKKLLVMTDFLWSMGARMGSLLNPTQFYLLYTPRVTVAFPYHLPYNEYIEHTFYLSFPRPTSSLLYVKNRSIFHIITQSVLKKPELSFFLCSHYEISPKFKTKIHLKNRFAHPFSSEFSASHYVTSHFF